MPTSFFSKIYPHRAVISVIFYVKENNILVWFKGCLNCSSACKFTLETLEALTHNQIKQELKNHGHPLSRQIVAGKKKIQRNKSLAIKELKNHYRFRHGF